MSDQPSSDHQALLARIHASLEGAGIPPAARDWLVKALHPAALHKCPAIPDHLLAQVVLPDFRTTTVVSAPAGVTGAWDLCVVQTPGDAIALWWGSGPAGTDFTALDPPTNSAGGSILMQPGEWLPDLQMRNAGTGASLNYGQQALESAPWGWRRRYGAITAYLTASALVDQGTVYAASFPAPYTQASINVDATRLAASGSPVMYKESRVNVPMDENALQLVSPKPFIAPARHGAYVPQRWIGADPDFILPTFVGNPLVFDTVSGDFIGVGPTTNAGWSEGTIPVFPTVTSNFGTYFASSYYNSSWVVSLAAAAGGQNLGATTFPILDTGMSPHSTGVIIFRGLANAASVTLRGMVGLEMIPKADSTQRQFAAPPGPGSELALDLYTRIASQLDPAYPASYNALGALLPVISSLIGTFGPRLGRFLFGSQTPRRQPNRMSEMMRVSMSDPRAPVMSEPTVLRPQRGQRRRRRRGRRGTSVVSSARSRSTQRSRAAVTPRRLRITAPPAR